MLTDFLWQAMSVVLKLKPVSRVRGLCAGSPELGMAFTHQWGPLPYNAPGPHKQLPDPRPPLRWLSWARHQGLWINQQRFFTINQQIKRPYVYCFPAIITSLYQSPDSYSTNTGKRNAEVSLRFVHVFGPMSSGNWGFGAEGSTLDIEGSTGPHPQTVGTKCWGFSVISPCFQVQTKPGFEAEESTLDFAGPHMLQSRLEDQKSFRGSVISPFGGPEQPSAQRVLKLKIEELSGGQLARGLRQRGQCHTRTLQG